MAQLDQLDAYLLSPEFQESFRLKRTTASLKNEAATNLTTYTRCEKDSFGKTSKVSGALAIQPGTGQTLVALCPAKTHANIAQVQPRMFSCGTDGTRS